MVGLVLCSVNGWASEPENSFPVAEPGYEWSFPKDHGAHPDYQTEWWYFTGIISSESRRFGFQFTVFRQRSGRKPGEESRWFTDQIYMGHMAVSSVRDRSHRSFMRVARGHPELGHASSRMPGTIRVRDWTCSFDGKWRIQAGDNGTKLSLTLIPTRSVLFQGPDGYSVKGPKKGQASQYYSQTRLRTEGTLTLDDREYSVKGRTWFDHEFGSSQLSENQVGWDWISLRLSDGSDLMIYRLREEGGAVSRQSSATLRRADGSVEYLSPDQWSMEPLNHWTSPKTGGRYPVKWRVRIEEPEIELTVNRAFNRQEMIPEMGLTPPYWEGVIQARGSMEGRKVQGEGYLELTGYVTSMGGSF